DIIPQYQAGSLSQTTVRLTDIKTFSGANLVADYTLAYQQSGGIGRSLLHTVTPCAGGQNCLASTNLSWTDADVAQIGSAAAAVSQSGNWVGWTQASAT